MMFSSAVTSSCSITLNVPPSITPLTSFFMSAVILGNEQRGSFGSRTSVSCTDIVSSVSREGEGSDRNVWSDW